MKKILKSLYLILCIIPLLLLFGCGSIETSSTSSDDDEVTSYEYDGSIISGLLDRIIDSSSTLESFPVKITSARLVRQGCLIHYDRIAYNEDYKSGSTEPDEAYFLNEEELDEQVAIADAYLNCSKVNSPYLDSAFAEYISSKEDGVAFTLYWLDGDVIFVSEINTP